MRTSVRRTFLKSALAGGAGLYGSRLAGAPQPEKALPSVPFGKTRISRLIAGANPVNGYGHTTRRMDELMLNYFTVERTTDFILHCEEEGITTWQTSYHPKVNQALRAARDRGSKIQVIFLAADSDNANWQTMLDLKPIAICHHGGVTDRLVRAGRQQTIHDYVKRVKDAGLLAGVSTHNPDNLALVEDSGWENDFYMTCFFYVTRPAEEIEAKLGDQFLGEPFLRDDPKRMTARVRQVKKPCLGFKILGAGRLCGNKKSVERAFEFAYANIKPTDATIVGMFPIFTDEVREDCDLVRRLAKV
jgi:hypothetical protein